MRKINRAEIIKQRIMHFIWLLLGFWFLTVAIITVCLWPSFHFKEAIPIAIIVCALVVFVIAPLILFATTVILKPLCEYVLFDSDEINKMFAFSKQKNYQILKLLQKKDKEIGILREDLEKIYFKMKNNTIDRRK